MKLQHNWLVHRVHDSELSLAIREYASGILLDIGCGEKPYRILGNGLVSQHFGLDHPGSIHNKINVDVFATAYETGIANNTVKTILCTAVLEHLEKPQDATDEMYRILEPGGYVILSTPLFWHLHEQPRDFYRYTKYGLEYLFREAGFDIVEIRPLSGFIVTFAQEFCYLLQRIRRRPMGWFVLGIQLLIQFIAYILNRWDCSYDFTWAYLMVTRKPTR
ncbi:MAG: methyltransferase domain-containing protein [Anaerolineales bacterium]|jgi:SAM-dependent methyltransferase